MKGLILFEDSKHIQWFYARASFLYREIDIIWVPIAICRVEWNNHQKLSQVQAFWYRVFQILLILNGRIDAMNNHKHMNFHSILIKPLINVMLKACFKIWSIDQICIWKINPITYRGVTGPLCGEFTGEFPSQRPVKRSFDVSFDPRLNKRLSKQSWCR